MGWREDLVVESVCCGCRMASGNLVPSYCLPTHWHRNCHECGQYISARALRKTDFFSLEEIQCLSSMDGFVPTFPSPH